MKKLYTSILKKITTWLEHFIQKGDNIRKKILSTFLLLIISIIALISIINITTLNVVLLDELDHKERIMKKDLIVKGTTLTRSMAIFSRNAIAGSAFSFLDDLITDTIKNDKEIFSGILMNDKFFAMVNIQKTKDGIIKNNMVDLSNKISTKFQTINTITNFESRKNNENIIEIISPIYMLEQQKWGYLILGLTTKYYEAEIAKEKNNTKTTILTIIIVNIGLLILFILISIGGSSFISKQITYPIDELTKSVKKFGKRNLSERTKVVSKDEVGILASNFNNMAEAINIYSDKMESLVEVRTGELNNAYKELNQTYEKLIEKDDIIFKDLLVSKRIQENILPDEIDRLDDCKICVRYHPMTEVGGDFYDIFKLPSGIIRIFLADATGHGVQAALVTMLIKSEFDKVKMSIDKPNKLLEELNNSFLTNYKSLTVFFSCIVLDIDLKNQRIQYCSAGHPTQFLISSSIINLPSLGKLIGIIEDIEYKMIKIECTATDKLMLFTDGLTEQFNKNNEEFGEERIIKIINEKSNESICTIIDSIINDMNAFISDSEKNDDVTVIGIEHLNDNKA